ncbi:MAG: FkbM family methyltransferase [Pseudomonadota bacterium]
MRAGEPIKTPDLPTTLERPPPFGTFAPTSFQQFVRKQAGKLPFNYFGRRLASLLLGFAGGRRPRPYDVIIFQNIRARLYPYDNISEKRVFLTPQHWDSDERKILSDAISSHTASAFNFLDVGANAGLYSLFAYSVAKQSGKCLSAVCIEPAEEMRRRLLVNVSLAGAEDNISTLAFAATAENGTYRLVEDQESRGMSRIERSADSPSSNTTRMVEGRTLKSLAEEADFDRIDALKIDIEGHESEALKPFFDEVSKTLWPTFVIIEVSHDHEARKILTDSGYRIIYSNPKNSIFKLNNQ